MRLLSEQLVATSTDLGAVGLLKYGRKFFIVHDEGKVYCVDHGADFSLMSVITTQEFFNRYPAKVTYDPDRKIESLKFVPQLGSTIQFEQVSGDEFTQVLQEIQQMLMELWRRR